MLSAFAYGFANGAAVGDDGLDLISGSPDGDPVVNEALIEEAKAAVCDQAEITDMENFGAHLLTHEIESGELAPAAPGQEMARLESACSALIPFEPYKSAIV